MSKEHLYKKLHIILVIQKRNDGKWLCRSTVDKTDWKPYDEIGDTKNAAMKKALEKAKEEIDRAEHLTSVLGVAN